MTMTTITAFILFGALATWLPQSRLQALEPTLTPIFNTSEPERGPAFLIECVNSTTGPLSSGSDEWPLRESAIRLDGQVLSNPGGGRIGPGVTMTVQPGETWRGYIELWQKRQAVSKAVEFGAMVRAPFVVPLDAGRHTIAVRCGQQWSSDVVFFVER